MNFALQACCLFQVNQSAPKPILVTGAHRSGTTWVGRMLAQASGVFYIHEPFSVTDPPGPGICNARFTDWFTSVARQNEGPYYPAVKNTIRLRYNLLAALKSSRSRANLLRSTSEWRAFRAARLSGVRTLIKDPIALFSAEWLAERFNMDVVIIIRHPAAFVSSLKRLNWPHPFAHFLRQPILMSRWLLPFEREIAEFTRVEKGIVEQAVLLWRLLHHVIRQYQQTHADWIYLRHEDISRNSVEEFRALYARLGLPMTQRVRAVIKSYSDVANPAEPVAEVGSAETLKRNSALNVWNWKTRLTPAEIAFVKKGVADISPAFYSDADW